MTAKPDHAMVLAAGLGKRMRPITDTLPKPLVRVAGKTLLDWGLDSLERAGIKRAVVNVHHLPDQIINHLKGRTSPQIVISDEREELLDSAGGIVKALPSLGDKPFYILNADTFWMDAEVPDLELLSLAWREDRMDILLMLASLEQATGHTGGTDFLMDGEGRLRRSGGDPAGLIYAGVAIISPTLFAAAKARPHSLNQYFNDAIAAGRLFGIQMKGSWITVGTPDAIEPAEATVLKAGGAKA
ncbi:MAG: nucleotidyltransferase family protein [Rhizobiaceae bacterium]|nr:nucleotidyltransferase family protein [Rhizobiaceae bacterium]